METSANSNLQIQRIMSICKFAKPNVRKTTASDFTEPCQAQARLKWWPLSHTEFHLLRGPLRLYALLICVRRSLFMKGRRFTWLGRNLEHFITTIKKREVVGEGRIYARARHVVSRDCKRHNCLRSVYFKALSLKRHVIGSEIKYAQVTGYQRWFLTKTFPLEKGALIKRQWPGECSACAFLVWFGTLL